MIGYTLYEKGGIDSVKLIEFLETFIRNNYKNKVIILDNASSHRNEGVKNTITKNNKLLYSVAYQHYTNAIEMFFSMLKSRLQKKSGLTYNRTDYMRKKIIRKYKNYKE